MDDARHTPIIPMRAEWKYFFNLLPVRAEERRYCYCSDPHSKFERDSSGPGKSDRAGRSEIAERADRCLCGVDTISILLAMSELYNIHLDSYNTAFFQGDRRRIWEEFVIYTEETG